MMIYSHGTGELTRDIRDVLFVPELEHGLISSGQLQELGCEIRALRDGKTIVVDEHDNAILQGLSEGKLCY